MLPFLSHMGKLRLGIKSDLMESLENLNTSDDSVDRTAEVIILDGTAVLNML